MTTWQELLIAALPGISLSWTIWLITTDMARRARQTLESELRYQESQKRFQAQMVQLSLRQKKILRTIAAGR
jgi:hypothetical protein